jgi:hypothetical protein
MARESKQEQADLWAGKRVKGRNETSAQPVNAPDL